MAYPGWQYITINDWSGGLAERYYESDLNHVKRGFPQGQYSTGTVNPVTVPGVLLPAAVGSATSTGATTVAAAIRKYVPYSSSVVYAMESGALFHEYNTSTNAITNPAFATITAGTNHAAHTTFVGIDAEAYQLNGTTSFYVLYKDNTDGDVARITTGGTVQPSYFSSIATGGTVLTANVAKLHKAANGLLYILDGNAIHKLDGSINGGASGTATLSVMDFPVGSLIKDADSWKRYMMVAVNEVASGSSLSGYLPHKKYVYFWDYLSVQGGDVDGFEATVPVETNGILEYVFVHNGIPHVFTRTSTHSEISVLSGDTFIPVKRLGPDDYPAFKGSFFRYLGLTGWISSANGIFLYGNSNPGQPDKLYQIENSVSGGAAINANVGGIIAAGTGDDNHRRLLIPITQTSTNTVNSTSSQNYRSDIYHLPMGSDIHGFYVYWESFTGGSNLNTTFNAYVNCPASGTPTQTFSINHQEVASGGDGDRGFKFIPYYARNVRSIQIGMGWPAAALNKNINPYRIDIAWGPSSRTR